MPSAVFDIPFPPKVGQLMRYDGTKFVPADLNDVVIDTNPNGPQLKVQGSTANGAVANTFGSVGPTGSNAGDALGWLKINVNGTDRYVPFW